MRFSLVMCLLLLACCTHSPTKLPTKNGKYVGHYKVGTPYTVQNSYVSKKKTFHPKEVEHYEKIGFASWYGDPFHGRKTANGEVYDKSTLTAAHRTLPLPCLVRVTNLDNNKSVVVRVHDRGPFTKQHNRIIDLSEKAAEVLGMIKSGVARVKVKLLVDETKNLHKEYNIKQNQ